MTTRFSKKKGDPMVFSIRVQAHLNSNWETRFGNLSITHEDDGSTTIHGSFPDQSAMVWFINQLHGSGLKILLFKRIEKDANDVS